jgi:hypothetical protein
MRFLDVGEYSNQIRRAEKGLDPAKRLYISLDSGGKAPLKNGDAEIEQIMSPKILLALQSESARIIWTAKLPRS